VPGVERIAIMPDAHVGNGACVGSAILTRDIVIPAAVGVDIGCGMIAAPLALRRSDLSNLPKVRAQIERRIPVGRTNNGQRGDRGAWDAPPADVEHVWRVSLARDYGAMVKKYPDLAHQFGSHHLGTLGTGNHFLEVCVELTGELDDPPLWLMLHSGSRGIGNKIGSWFTRKARSETIRAGITLPDPELGFLSRGTELFADYLRYAQWPRTMPGRAACSCFERARAGLALRWAVRRSGTTSAALCIAITTTWPARSTSARSDC